jgi:hypothetical protein
MEILKTILKINPQAQVTVRGSDINTCEIEWHNGTTQISKEEILAMIPIVEQEINTINNRVKEYGSWQSQLDEIYHNGIDAWKQRITNIKNKYPKE